MKKLLFLLPILVMFSCKKDKPEIPTFYTVSDFQPMRIGSYWIYRQFNVDTNGVRTPLERMDSLVVEKDTIINGNTYAKFVNYPLSYNGMPSVSNLRDSSGFLKNEWGILFGISNSTDTLFKFENSYELFITKMTGIDSLITVEAGTFATRSLGEFYFHKLSNGELKPLNPQSYHSYAPHVGRIASTHFNAISAPYASERRLVRYFIAE